MLGALNRNKNTRLGRWMVLVLVLVGKMTKTRSGGEDDFVMLALRNGA
jgi:hypothetical protein